MSDVTLILRQIEDGDPSAAEQLLPLVYEELRKLAAARMVNESPDHTLQATALVHEAYVRLVDGQQAQHWNSRGHFFGAAAEAMRRILVDSARRRNTEKRGAGFDRQHLTDVAVCAQPEAEEVLALDDALTQLAQIDPPAARLVELRYFAGLTMEQAAEVTSTSVRTAKRTWTYARSWLFAQLQDG